MKRRLFTNGNYPDHVKHERVDKPRQKAVEWINEEMEGEVSDISESFTEEGLLNITVWYSEH
jgi:hypothetical protein